MYRWVEVSLIQLCGGHVFDPCLNCTHQSFVFIYVPCISGGGGGGCSLSTRPSSFDPLLPMLLILSMIYLVSSRSRQTLASRA